MGGASQATGAAGRINVPRILLAGFDADLKNVIKARLGGYPVTCVASVEEAADELAGGSVSLLIFDGRLATAQAIAPIHKLYTDLQSSDLPIICFGAPWDAIAAGAPLRICAELHPPLDAEALVHHAAQALNIQIEASSKPAAKTGEIAEVIAQARRRVLDGVSERLKIIDQAGMALLEGHLEMKAREDARREAHKLAGILLTVGFPAGSRFAREIEDILESGGRLSPALSIRYSELAVALRLNLEGTARDASTLEAPHSKPDHQAVSILLVDSDDDLAERLDAEALGSGAQLARAVDFIGAFKLIEQERPDVVLADLSLSQSEQGGFDFIERLSARKPPIPVIVLISNEGLTNRVEVARRGGHGFLARSASPARIIEATLKLVDRLHSEDLRVMAVDDDVEMLRLISSLLESRGVTVTTVSDPTTFWERLDACSPDLLVLDVDMPGFGGIDLCRVVRGDSRWSEMPILFLTGQTGPDVIQSVFAAGADDFISKPFAGPELLTRIFNRLERSRMRRRMQEIDALTGAFNRHKAVVMIKDFLDLARRHEQPFSLAALELENLKEINASFGQAAGDVALDRAARRLRNAFRSEDVFARWGGGEFVVGMYGLARPDGVQRLTSLLERICKDSYEAPGGGKFSVAMTAGVAEFPADGTNIEELHQAAARARSAVEIGCLCAAATPAGHGNSQEEKPDVALVIRDEAQASLLGHTLESLGYRTRWIQDGRSAQKLLSGPSPTVRARVAVVEVDLPGTDGISLLKQFGAEGMLETMKVIILTTPSVDNEASAVLALGAFDSLAKPLNPPVIAQHVRRALNA